MKIHTMKTRGNGFPGPFIIPEFGRTIVGDGYSFAFTARMHGETIGEINVTVDPRTGPLVTDLSVSSKVASHIRKDAMLFLLSNTEYAMSIEHMKLRYAPHITEHKRIKFYNWRDAISKSTERYRLKSDNKRFSTNEDGSTTELLRPLPFIAAPVFYMTPTLADKIARICPADKVADMTRHINEMHRPLFVQMYDGKIDAVLAGDCARGDGRVRALYASDTPQGNFSAARLVDRFEYYLAKKTGGGGFIKVPLKLLQNSAGIVKILEQPPRGYAIMHGHAVKTVHKR